MASLRFLAVLIAIAGVPTAEALAQPLGAFRWQIQPYCNVLTVYVTQQGGIYTLDGADDRCGAEEAASVHGVAFANVSGSIGFGLTTVLPDGTPVHTRATIGFPSLNGTWRDSSGNSGSFVFTPGSSIGGPTRPVAVGGTRLTSAPDVSNVNLPSGSPTIVTALTVVAPSAGRVLLNTNGNFYFPGTATADDITCSITTGTFTAPPFAGRAIEGSPGSMLMVPFAGSRVFDVAAGSSINFRLVCFGYGTSMSINAPVLTALFVPGS